MLTRMALVIQHCGAYALVANTTASSNTALQVTLLLSRQIRMSQIQCPLLATKAGVGSQNTQWS